MAVQIVMKKDNSTTLLIQKFLAEFDTHLFPPPPDLESDDILPISTIEELAEESLEMHNCLMSYTWAIMSEGCYVYKVMLPERATLEIAGKNVSLKQLKTDNNGEPSQKTYQAVERVLREYREKHPCLR